MLAILLVTLFMARSPRRETAAAPPVGNSSPVPSRPAPATPPQTQAPASGGNWSVVAATYAQRKDADKRAGRINLRFPRFTAEVRAPSARSEKPYYLVILGSNLSEKEAATLRQRARSAGVARDAYVTRFAR